MQAHEPTTVSGILIDRAGDAKGWSQPLHAWWASHRAVHLASLSTRWDAMREVVTPVRADAAIDMVASTHAFSTITAFCDLSI